MSFLGLGMGGTGKVNAGGNPAMDQHPIQGGVEILLIEFVCALDNHILAAVLLLAAGTKLLSSFIDVNSATE